MLVLTYPWSRSCGSNQKRKYSVPRRFRESRMRFDSQLLVFFDPTCFEKTGGNRLFSRRYHGIHEKRRQANACSPALI